MGECGGEVVEMMMVRERESWSVAVVAKDIGQGSGWVSGGGWW